MKLCEFASKNGQDFAFQMAFVSAISLANSTFCFFELYFAIKERVSGVNLYYSVFATIFNLYLIIFMTLIMGTSSLTANEGEKTLEELGISNRQIDNDARELLCELPNP